MASDEDDFRGTRDQIGTPGSDTVVVVQQAQSNDASEEVWSALRDGANPETLALLDELKQPPRRTWAAQLGMLFISLIVFVSLGFLRWSATEIAVLVVVLFVHEIGHYVAMLGFGYRDVRMFFIPLFGAAVSGSAADAPGYQRTLVALSGPVPGIFIGVFLALVFAVSGHPGVGFAAKMFLALNAFNLLPLLPLDGGRVLNETLFCRSRWWEAGFQGAAALGLLLLAIAAGDVIFGLLSLLMLATVRGTFKVNAVAARLRESGEAPDVAAPSDASLSYLLRIASDVQTEFAGRVKPRQLADMIRTVIEKLHPNPPAAWATVLLLAAYGGAFVAALIGSVLIVARQMPPGQ